MQTQPSLTEPTQTTISLNYINWDILSKTIAGSHQTFEDFIAEIELNGIDHREKGKHIWINILFKKSEAPNNTLLPVLLEVTATEGFKDVVLARRDIYELKKPTVEKFFEDTKRFFNLFDLPTVPSKEANPDRKIVFENTQKVIFIGDEPEAKKTLFITPEQKEEQINFILSYLKLKVSDTKISFLSRLQKLWDRLFKVT